MNVQAKAAKNWDRSEMSFERRAQHHHWPGICDHLIQNVLMTWVERRPLELRQRETKNSRRAHLVRLNALAVCVCADIIGCCARDERPETYCIPVAGRRENKTWLKQNRESWRWLKFYYIILGAIGDKRQGTNASWNRKPHAWEKFVLSKKFFRSTAAVASAFGRGHPPSSFKMPRRPRNIMRP